MSAIENIQRYITETNVDTEDAETYCMYVGEMKAFYDEMHRDAFDAMLLIFNYGRAKGYRAAKAGAEKLAQERLADAEVAERLCDFYLSL